MHKFLSLVAGLVFSHAAQADLVFEQASVRLMPAMQKNTAAFMKITNTGSEPVSLIEANSNISEKTEFHTHIVQNDMMMMKKMDQLIIPANQSIILESGAKHIMLLDLKRNWADQGEVEFIFRDKHQKSYSVIAPIQAMHHAQKPEKMEHKHHNH